MAPPALSTADWPAQIFVGLAIAKIVGVLFTLTLTTAWLEQVPLLPITVYVVLMVGETTIGDPDPPFDQL